MDSSWLVLAMTDNLWNYVGQVLVFFSKLYFNSISRQTNT